MPYRDDFSRLCGAIFYKDKDGNWDRKLAILDEEECLFRFFNPYAFCPKTEKLWNCPDGEINTRLITKIEKKEDSASEESVSQYFEIQMFDTAKHFLKAETEEEIDEWINNLHRVVVDPTRRQEGKIRRTIKNTLPRESEQKAPTSEAQLDQSPEHISYETKIIGGVVVRRPVSKKVDSDTESLSGGSHFRSMSGGPGIKTIKEGYMYKKGAVVRNWKKRYFRLDRNKLGYYEKDTDKEPIRSIANIDIMFVRTCASNEGNRENLFEVITPSRTFTIQADTQEEMESWVKEIQKTTNSIQGRSSSDPL
ncbi:pleckstrin homology domain-containing family A member 1-like isoform X2 [Actinia tenebrosa]|uniref:Pleckstrin homology domain-containing family A member 1-like isoform X2 n=1 Tax=Actinia tenebrosa TaxID=6105 RepID=A0A6P8IT38_ACTTE|nr:pleckstrin homology domain-containing family A member 1-like isoform X2 [Actinia tenebrosa]